MRCPPTRFPVRGGVWLHSGKRKRGKPLYAFHADRPREAMPKYDTNPRREESAG